MNKALWFVVVVLVVSILIGCNSTADEPHEEYVPEVILNDDNKGDLADGSEVEAAEPAEIVAEDEPVVENETIVPCKTIVKEVEIHYSLPLHIARLDAFLLEQFTWSSTGRYEVNITIMLEDESIVQEISLIAYWRDWWLHSGWQGGVETDNNLNFHFADYNNDGFLDMGLRISEGGTMGNDPSFFWLWDVELGEFLWNSELYWMSATGGRVWANDDGTVTVASSSLMSGWMAFFEYVDGKFVEIRNYVRQFTELNNGWVVVNTFPVGEVAFPRIEIVRFVNITPEFSTFRIGLEAFEKEQLGYGLSKYKVNITVMLEDYTIVQQITTNAYWFDDWLLSGWRQEVWVGNHLNFHFVDYDGNGFLDMGLRWARGGSAGNDPHLFWSWDEEMGKFQRNEYLEHMSGGFIYVEEDGRLTQVDRNMTFTGSDVN